MYKNTLHFFESVWAVIVNGYPARKLKVIGVTGTDGKTTTCHLIYEMLIKAGKRVALISTVAAYLDNQQIDTGFHVTTPAAKVLQPLIKELADKHVEYLVLEATSHGLSQHRVLGCNFLVGVLTNVTHEHLDYHKNFADYLKTKAKLFRRVKYAVLNQDDPSFEYFKSRSGGKVIPYGKANIKSSLTGDYNQYNLGAAVAVTKIFGADTTAWSVAQKFRGVPGRMEEIRLHQKFRAIIDFAHTPNGLEKLLTQLTKKLLKGKKLILVFGCAGLRDTAKRPMMGQIAARLADQVIITAEDPRTENLDNIYEQITNGKDGFVREDDRQKAINIAVKMAKPGDIVVVTGKGHEKSMCFGTTEYPWSDREAVETAIES